MDSLTLRALIRTKLADGRLPAETMPRVWGGPGNGERCDACEEIITSKELIMEGLAPSLSCSSTSSASTSEIRSAACSPPPDLAQQGCGYTRGRLKKAPMRGGARRPHASIFLYVSVRPRASTKQMGLFQPPA